MREFIRKHAGAVVGVLSGFDRLVFRGTLRRLSFVEGMRSYLGAVGVLLKDFGEHMNAVTQRVKSASLCQAEGLNRPVVYLASSCTSKEEVARRVLAEHPVDAGLICVLKSVEPCWGFDVHRNPDRKLLELVLRRRKCLFYYHYFLHPVFGFMHARLQTWFPFSVQVCLNGREWLARQMDSAGLTYERRDNCFTGIEDFVVAQRLFNEQLRVSWPVLLGELAGALNPAHDEIFRMFPVSYYWTTHQSEWATDVLFRTPDELARRYRRWLHHGMTTFDSPAIMRFLGRRTPAHGGVAGRFEGEVSTDLRRRPEGVRIKHRLDGNSVKLYDKQGQLLRVETTINQPKPFKVYRPKEGEPDGPLQWQSMRKGIADLHRRAEVSQACNERYLEALAAVDDSTALSELTKGLCRPTAWKGRRVRALRPWSADDGALLAAVTHGEFAINGFRNRDLRELLYTQPAASKEEERRRSSRVTRLLGMLRAHGLIQKVPKTHRYHLTKHGRVVITALLAARAMDVSAFTERAAERISAGQQERRA